MHRTRKFFKLLPALAILVPMALLFAGVEPEIREEIYRAETALVVRAEPNIYSNNIRVLKKGTYIDGTLNGDVETIQGKSGKWLAIPGVFLDRHVFTGFMSRQTGKVRKQLVKNCEIGKGRLQCADYQATIAKNVMVYADGSGCPGTHFHQHPLKVDASGAKALDQVITKVPKEFTMAVFTDLQSGELVQLTFSEFSPDCL